MDRLAGGSLADAVYEQLRQAIDSGEIGAGSALREAEVAARLGVSRTPVREALHRLESEEALVKKDRSLIVPLVGDRQILELYAMREVLEGAAAGLAARSASEAEIDVLARILTEQGGLAEQDAARHAALNIRFHEAIYRAANNRYLLKSLNSLQDAIRRLQTTTFSWPGRPKRALREHRAIQRAIAARDAASAEEAARRHIREALRVRMMLIQDREGRPGAGG